MSVSLICACKNRYEALRVSLSSWLSFKEISEIIIVDWSSDESISHLTELDERINVITVENQQYFNQPQPLNLAVSIAKNKYILKVDSDYILNPYYNFFKKYTIDDNSFVSGKNSYQSPEVYSEEQDAYVLDFTTMHIDEIREYCNSYSPYFKYLTGLLYITKENFIKVGGYNENLKKHYSYEDDELYQRLELFGLSHKKISCDYFLIHIPHQDQKRVENFEGYSEENRVLIKNNLTGMFDENIELEWQTDYVMAISHTNANKELVGEVKDYYVNNSTKWSIIKSDKKRNFIGTMIEDTTKNNLENFPYSYYVSLEESVERQKSLHEQFSRYGIDDITPILSKRFAECNDKVKGEMLHILDGGTIGCTISHLKAIQKWYEEKDDDYAFFCEDDLSLETVENWNFTWNQFIEKLPDDTECVQLTTVRPSFESVHFRERSMYDWSVTAYIMTRDYARKVLERHVFGDEYDLTIPGTNFYPMPENVLFYGLGKVYVVELFVENNHLSTTFNQIEGGHKEYHKESYDFVSNWWKTQHTSLNQLFGLQEMTVKNELENLLTQYSADTENPEYNFALGLWYEREGHTAPALSYFLRCAERADDLLAYEALIHGSICYERQGTRDVSSKGLLQQALCLLPTRPEAYFLLSNFSEKRQSWQDCYIYADNALNFADLNSPPLRTNVGYPGTFGLLFEKAVSGWWWGKNEESGKLLKDLYENYQMPEEYKNSVLDNLQKYFPDLLDSNKNQPSELQQINCLDSIEKIQEEYNIPFTIVPEIGKMDIVLQGRYDEYTNEIIDQYLKIPFVNNVIVSCWNMDRTNSYHSTRVKYIRNEYPSSPGTDNRNLQIVGSLSGLNFVKTEYSAKMRTDQKYSIESMCKMYDYMMNRREYEDQIFVAGIYPNLLFHPRDHIFWGRTCDLKELFDIPLEFGGLIDKIKVTKENLHKYYPFFTRTETYIGSRYCSKFDERINLMILDPEKYLYDNCPEWNHSHQISQNVIKRAFKSFPRYGIDLEWTRKGWLNYPYDDQKNGYGECWAEDGY